MTETAEIARAARKLRGTVDTIAAELVDHIQGAPHFPADDATLLDRAAYRRQVHENWLAVSARRHWLTLEFARLRGWTFKRSDHFTQPMLAEHRKRHGRRDDAWAGRGWADHSHYFRGPNGYPAAVVAHPYEGDFGGPYQTMAEVNGLAVSFPTDFPSWWYPGRTRFVLFEPAADADRRAAE